MNEGQLSLHPQSPTPFSAGKQGLGGGSSTGLAEEGRLISAQLGREVGVREDITEEVGFVLELEGQEGCHKAGMGMRVHAAQSKRHFQCLSSWLLCNTRP